MGEDVRYFVTGGTGFIGSHLVEQLIDAGHHVTVLTRDLSSATGLPERATLVEGNITDATTMRDPMDGVDGVFHLAGWYRIGPGPWNTDRAERINVDGTRTVLGLVDELNIPRAVYVSTAAIYADGTNTVYDETKRPSRRLPSVYQRTKWQAHYEVAEPMAADGLPLLIVTPGAVYGPGDKAFGGTLRAGLVDYLNGSLPAIPRGFVSPFDHVEDVAAAIIAAFERGVGGNEYVISSEPRRMVELFETAETITDIPAPRAVPDAVFDWAGRLMAVIERASGRRLRSPDGIESETLRFLGSGGVRIQNTRAKQELGLEHRSLAAGLRDYFMWERGSMAK